MRAAVKCWHPDPTLHSVAQLEAHDDSEPANELNCAAGQCIRLATRDLVNTDLPNTQATVTVVFERPATCGLTAEPLSDAAGSGLSS